MEVREILIDDGIEFEIIATPDEVKEIEILFHKMKDDSIESLKSILIPFNEQKVDAERESYDAHLIRSEEHTSELQSRGHLVCRLLLEKKKKTKLLLVKIVKDN